MPGNHSNKWRRLVQHLKDRCASTGKCVGNPYAVATSALGPESFSPFPLEKVPQSYRQHSKAEHDAIYQAQKAVQRAKHAYSQHPSKPVRDALRKAEAAKERAAQAFWAGGAGVVEHSQEAILHACHASGLAGVEPPAHIEALCHLPRR